MISSDPPNGVGVGLGGIVGVGVGVSVEVAVRVGVEVAVGVGVMVAVGVKVGPSTCPGWQAVMLSINIKFIAINKPRFILPPLEKFTHI
jgi:hypothetical protein